MNYLLFILFLIINYSCGPENNTSGPPANTYGCMNLSSCNYDPSATVDNQSCWEPNDNCSCEDGQGSTLDCNNTCGGTANYDSCGVCSGGDTGITINQCGIITDGCHLPENSIGFVPKKNYEEWGRIIYNIDSPIGGFQFNINNIIYTPHPQLGLFYGGEAEFEQFAFSQTEPGSPILAFNLLGNIIQESCGDLTNISYEIDFSSNSDQVYIDGIVFSDDIGNEVNMTFYDTCSNNNYDCNGICSGMAYIDACSNCTEGLTGESDCLDGYIDCYGNIGIDADIDVTEDCLGVCGGNAIVDCAGECNGASIEDCAGICAGQATIDCAGVCNGFSIEDCAGICGGTASLDCANTCNGPATIDCDGECEGSSILDDCGICNGDGTTCQLTACDIDVNSLYLNHVDGANYNIFYNTSGTENIIAGFQFNVLYNDDSTENDVPIESAYGGDADINNFTVTPSNSLLLGFSFNGGTITSGCGILTNVVLDDENINFTNANELKNIVISDPDGNQITEFHYYSND